MFQKVLQGGMLQGGSEGISVFTACHPHTGGLGYKSWEYIYSLDSKYCSYKSSDNTITILNDFNAYIRYEWLGGTNASLEINGEQVTPVSQKLNLIERKLVSGDIIKHYRLDSNDIYSALIVIVAR